jgi:hypothetical protein
LGRSFLELAAVAAVVVAAAAVVVVATAVVAAAAGEQQDQDDDPPAGVATEAVVVAHNEYLQEFFRAFCRSFQDIPQPKKGAKKSLPCVKGGGCPKGRRRDCFFRQSPSQKSKISDSPLSQGGRY